MTGSYCCLLTSRTIGHHSFCSLSMIEPIVSRVSRWRGLNRPLAVGMILSALGLGLTVALGVLVPLTVGQALSFGESLRSGRYDTAISRVVALVPDEYRGLDPRVPIYPEGA